MSTKELITWGLLIYLIWRGSPQGQAAAASDAAKAAIGSPCSISPQITTLQTPRWIQELAAHSAGFTFEA